MAKSNIFVGLEIGTHKICVVVGDAKSDGSIKILGVGQAPSRGVRKGEIVDFEIAQTCLQEALVRAEDRSDVMVRKVWLAITGPHLESVNNRGVLRIPDDQSEITEDDIEEVKEQASNVAIPPDNIFLHRIIRHYWVDGQEKVQNPVGMLGRKLEADYHIVHGIRNRVQNTIRCLREFPLEVEAVVFGPIAAAQVVLNREARQQGALLLDIGGGTTDYVLYEDGAIAASGSIGVGGDHISNDLAIVLKIPQARADRLKVEHGSVLPVDGGSDPVIHLEGDGSFDGVMVDREVLNGVIRARMEETFHMVRKRILASGASLDRVAAGLFLCGGSSLLRGLDHLAEEVFNVPVRRSSFTPMTGLTSNFESPQYATPIGLIRYAQRVESERPARTIFRRMKDLMDSVLSGTR
ncbi:MAG: cell division protein FtsA [Verrucomicrobiota bacterium]